MLSWLERRRLAKESRWALGAYARFCDARISKLGGEAKPNLIGSVWPEYPDAIEIEFERFPEAASRQEVADLTAICSKAEGQLSPGRPQVAWRLARSLFSDEATMRVAEDERFRVFLGGLSDAANGQEYPEDDRVETA